MYIFGKCGFNISVDASARSARSTRSSGAILSVLGVHEAVGSAHDATAVHECDSTDYERRQRGGFIVLALGMVGRQSAPNLQHVRKNMKTSHFQHSEYSTDIHLTLLQNQDHQLVFITMFNIMSCADSDLGNHVALRETLEILNIQ